MITIRKEALITQGTPPFTYQWINSTSGCGVSFSDESGTTTGFVETDVIFATAACVGVADISLQVIDSEGCSNTFTVDFVNPCATSPITQFSQQVAGNIVTITAVTTNTGLDYTWSFDSAVFTEINTVENTITLQVNNPRPNVINSTIYVTSTDAATGCTFNDFYSYPFCNPTALDKSVSICRFDEAGSSALVCFDVNECTSAIDWSTLQVTLPTGFTFTAGTDNCGNISVPVGVLGGMYNTGTWTVSDLQGGISNAGGIFISYTNCNSGTSCIASPDIVKALTCMEIGNLPGIYTLIDLDDILVTNNCPVDWSTFYFVAGLGQTATGTGVGAQLNTSFGSVALNANHELVYTFTTQPTGSAEVVTWCLASTNGDQTGNVQLLISYDCTIEPIANDDAFVTTCEAPFTFNDILANDTGNINSSTVAITTQPLDGTVIVNTTGEVQYTPGTTIGDITFGYTVTDYDNQVSNEAIVTMTVICAGEDTTIDQCGDITITPFDLLNGNKTINGTWLQTSVGGPTIPVTYNGTMDFTGIADGIYTYDYTVNSGTESHTATLTINHLADCCTGITITLDVTGETLFSNTATNEARVQLSWNFNGNLYTGTIDFDNQAEGTNTNVVLTGASSTGSVLAAYNYSPAALQDHPVVATFTLTNAAGCTCTAVVNMFDIPLDQNVPITFTYTGNC